MLKTILLVIAAILGVVYLCGGIYFFFKAADGGTLAERTKLALIWPLWMLVMAFGNVE